MIIIGAGQAGLLAARRLSSYNPIVLEKQKSLPNNHSALLRFRSNEIGKAIGLPFKKVNVYKGILSDDGETITDTPTIRDMNAYSLKSTGVCIERSIINTDKATRYIAPNNFIKHLSHNVDIEYENNCEQLETKIKPIISTIPMPELMKLLDYRDAPVFKLRPIWTINCELLNVDVYQTLYIPYGNNEPYRVSITGNRMTMELTFLPPGGSALNFIDQYLDILFDNHQITIDRVQVKEQPYGKIIPIDEYERQKFILWATDTHGIYSLGRYATWRQILLDDVLKDIKHIQNFISHRNNYQRVMHWPGDF